MTGHREALTSYRKKEFTTQVELGDDSTYKIEEVGSTSLQLDFGMVMHIDDVLYVPGLKKNLLSVAGLENKGYRVLFVIHIYSSRATIFYFLDSIHFSASSPTYEYEMLK